MKRYVIFISLAIILALSVWWSMPTQKALADTCTWTGNSSTSWTDGGNWTGCATVPPTTSDSVVIPDVSLGSNRYPVINSDVMIVSLTIDSSASLTVNTGSLTINGDFVCNGTFTATGRPVTFSGATSQTVSGSGTATFGSITINSGVATNTVNISMTPSGSFNADAGFLTLTRGILEFSGTYGFTKNLFSTSDYIIGLNTGIWLNNPNVTISAILGSTHLQGYLQITAGNFNVGDAVNKSLIYNLGAKMVMEGGFLNVAGIFAGNPAGEPYASISIRGGSFTIGTVVGFSSSNATFNAQGFTNIETTGGTVIIQNENTGTGHDFRINIIGGWSATGGTIQFGNGSTSGSPSFEIDSPSLPSIAVVSNGSNTPSVGLFDYFLTVNGSLSISARSTLNANTYGVSVLGNSGTPANLTNNGIVIANVLNVVGTLTNNGMLSQTQAVNGGSYIPFLRTGGYGGVRINANNSDLGPTTVTIRGNQDCTTVPGETVKRCFDITPTNSSNRDATIAFYFADSELSGNNCASLNAYHFIGGVWELIPYANLDCVLSPYNILLTHVSSFSPFVLKQGAPTAITLRNLTAKSNTRISLLLLAAAWGSQLRAGCCFTCGST